MLIKSTVKLCVVITLVIHLGGCITETSGGLPGPASADQRVDAQLDLARGYLEQRDWARARPPLERALGIDADNVEAHVLLAVLLYAEGEYQIAERHYKTALRVEPKNAQALNNYGTFLYARGRYDDAIEQLSRLVKDTSYRARPQAFENLGLAQLQVGETAAAKHAFERALELNYKQPRANLELAELAYQEGDLDTAANRLKLFNNFARQNARSTCLGLKLAVADNNPDLVASYGLALRNLFPDQADQCQTQR